MSSIQATVVTYLRALTDLRLRVSASDGWHDELRARFNREKLDRLLAEADRYSQGLRELETAMEQAERLLDF